MDALPFQPSAHRDSSRAPLAILLGIGLTVRLAVFLVAWHNSPDLSGLYSLDTPTYLQPAESLLRSGIFSRDGVTEVIRTPGYSIFLMPGILLGHVEIVTVALQVLISLATIWLVYRLTWNLTADWRASLAAASFFAIEPLSVAYTSCLLSETVFSFLVMLTLLALTRYLNSDSLPPLIAAGLLLVAATFVRPVTYFLPAGLTALLVVRSLWNSPHWNWRRWSQAGVFLIVCAVPIAGWQTRNYLTTGYSGFSAITDWNLYFILGASVVARENSTSIEEAQAQMGYLDPKLFDRLHPELPAGDQAAKFSYLRQEGKRLLRQNAAAYAKMHLRGIALLLLNPAASDALKLIGRYIENQRHPRPIDLGLIGIIKTMANEAPLVLYTNLTLAIGLGVIYGTAVIGALSALRRPTWQLTLLASVAVYFIAVSGGPVCAARLRHPIMPIICIVSGLGCGEAHRWLRRWKHQRHETAENPTPLPAGQAIEIDGERSQGESYSPAAAACEAG